MIRLFSARSAIVALLLSFAWMSSGVDSTKAADERQVKLSINSGLQALREFNFSFRPVTGLVVYTLLVGGDELDSPAVARGLSIIEGKFDRQTGEYRPTQHHIYEAAIDAMALQKADDEAFRPQLEAIATYLIEQQAMHGGWFYPNRDEANFGDTSITQYAVLGLWAAERAGVVIPNDVYLKAMRWHTGTQNGDGGFAYHPRPRTQSSSTGTMSTAGAGSLGIIRLILIGGPDFSGGTRGSSKKFGLLEAVKPKQTGIRPAINRGQVRPVIKPAIDRAGLWVAGRFEADSIADHNGFLYYYYYTLERAAAVNAWDEINGVDWYDHGAEILLKRQAANGHWSESGNHSNIAPSSTCFALLFLMKSTQKLLPQRPESTRFGEGVLAGGRGLPDDLTRVQFRNGRVETEQELGDFNTLLQGLSQIELEAPEPEKEAESVDLTRPELLVGDVTLLKRLAEHDDSRVRQLAAWALGRTDRLDAAAPLLQLMTDENLDVCVEARAAMCWLARRPNGFGLEPDPRLFLEPTLSDQEKAEQIQNWRRDVETRWMDWYLRNRPYSERDDFDDPLQRPYGAMRP